MTNKAPIKVFTSFSGYDSQCMALDRLGVDYDLVGWSEIDPYAIQAHDLIFPQFADRNLGDITAIDWAKVPDFELFTMSSPCQDFSNAGLQQGGQEGSGTRSSLLWECRRAIVAKRPQYIVFENVKGLVSRKFLPYFLKWQAELSSLGYTNFAQVLNAKQYGVAQNRERVFLVSILGGGWFDFPQKQRLTKCLADYLEPEVAEKYYLSEKMKIFLNGETGKNGGFRPMKCRNKKGICMAVNSRIWKMGKQDNYVVDDGGSDRIRRLTPRECFRLMDVLDNDFDKLQGLSDTQLYKMAGNSIVVACLSGIFKNLLNPWIPQQPPVRAHFAPVHTPAHTL